MVRAVNVESMMDANEKVNRSFHAAAIALGGEVIIEDTIEYLPLDSDNSMDLVFKKNYMELLGESDEELAYIIPAKAMAMTLIDLLVDDAKIAKDIIKNFKPTFTKESYLDFMNKNTNTYKYDYKK